jgi:hydroxymethylpyrimidine pyrophosphatase-like HAD family hydrolase
VVLRQDGRVNAPRLGLLLDVDGPIASPLSRTIAIPSIIEDLVALAAEGIPVVFNTGRSDAFIREQVVGPLLAGGLAAGGRVHAVCEKGAVWCSIGPQFADGMGELTVAEDLALPRDFADEMRDLVRDEYADLVFFDETKRAMVSIEQLVEVENAAYLARQPAFDAQAMAALERRGLGVRRLDDVRPDERGAVDWRVDPTIISTDIESDRSGKDLGAERALELLAEDGALPLEWRTVGDSRSDYAMADWLHANGHRVAHVDVRPADGVPETPYPVLTAPDGVIHDEAGARFLREWRTA